MSASSIIIARTPPVRLLDPTAHDDAIGYRPYSRRDRERPIWIGDRSVTDCSTRWFRAKSTNRHDTDRLSEPHPDTLTQLEGHCQAPHRWAWCREDCGTPGTWSGNAVDA